jgi:hypothetical protein
MNQAHLGLVATRSCFTLSGPILISSETLSASVSMSCYINVIAVSKDEDLFTLSEKEQSLLI